MNEAQMVKLWRYAGREASRTVLQHRDLLRLYGTLRPEQRTLAHGPGLTIDHFDVAQQKLLPTVVARVRPGELDLAHSFVRLEVREQPKALTATLTLVFRDGERRTAMLDRTAKPAPDPLGITGYITGPSP